MSFDDITLANTSERKLTTTSQLKHELVVANVNKQTITFTENSLGYVAIKRYCSYTEADNAAANVDGIIIQDIDVDEQFKFPLGINVSLKPS